VSETGDGLDRRARLAAARLRRAAEVPPPDLQDLVTVSRVARIGRGALIVALLAILGGFAFAVGEVAAPATVRWATAVILLVLLGATVLLCAHAGGHAWFVPLPAIALAVVWALTASANSPAAGWLLVALCATASAGAVLVGTTALRQRLRGSLVGLRPLRGTDGVAVTDLDPVGVVQVAGEKWSAESVSGSLPAGAPVHVLAVRGVRLEVWSEMGTVPDGSVFDSKEDQP
jgi:membrane protein implicated in regulation of membrane protease activity